MAPPTKSAKTRERRRSLRLHGRVARDIGVAIVSGDRHPGDLLDGEIDASDRLNVSRSAYREAIRILAAKGLVEVKPKVGTRVSARDKWHLLDPDLLAWMFEHEPDEHLLKSLFELRKVVEPEAAALAANRRSEAHVEKLEDALERMAEHTLASEEGRVADQDFHAALLDASDNPFLKTLTSSVAAAVAWTTEFKQRHQPLVRDPIPDHVDVYRAIAAANPEKARQAMAHLVEMALFDTTTAPRRKPSKNTRSRAA
jgi:DNA-binding FadR family transcriptional regulator